MQLYNEWLHQMSVGVRDALLPFENWEQVSLPLALHGGFRGLRGLEPARDRFLAEFLTRILPHASVVDFARSLFEAAGTRGTARDGDLYGFQAESGLVLPAVVGRDDVDSAPGGLLMWHPARVASPPTGQTLAFRHAFADYLAAPRSPIGPPSDDVDLLDEAAIVAEPADEDSVRLRVELVTDAFLSGRSRPVPARPALYLQARRRYLQPLQRQQYRPTSSATISAPCSRSTRPGDREGRPPSPAYGR